jgi:hypothetical protein
MKTPDDLLSIASDAKTPDRIMYLCFGDDIRKYKETRQDINIKADREASEWKSLDIPTKKG